LKRLLLLIAACFLSPAFAQSISDSTASPILASTASPESVKNGRLAILLQEKADTTAKITAALNAQEKAVTAEQKTEGMETIARLNGDLQALLREIDRVSKEPAINTSWKGSESKGSQSISVSSNAPQKTASEDKKYEDWDVFKNFSK
jgi:hypothetical protein